MPRSTESLMLRNKTHTGPVRGLDFNPIQSHLFASGAVNGEVRRCPPPTLCIREAESSPSRFTSGISETLPSPILPETAVRNSMKLPRSPGTITYNTFSPLRAVPDTPSCGICVASERSPVLCMEGGAERLAELRASLLVDWLLVEGEV